MPRAQDTRSFSFPGYSFQDAASVIEFTGIVAVEKELPAVAAAKTGSLTTRTDDNTGVATLSTAHGILTNDVVDAYWSGGIRFGMVATVSGNAVSLEGGTGDNLPAQDTPCTVIKQTAMEVNLPARSLSWPASVRSVVVVSGRALAPGSEYHRRLAPCRSVRVGRLRPDQAATPAISATGSPASAESPPADSR